MEQQMYCCLLGICCGRAEREQVLREQGFTDEQIAWTLRVFDGIRATAGSEDELTARYQSLGCKIYRSE